jgi:hypothetical protein
VTEPSQRLAPRMRDLVAADRNGRPTVGALTPDEIQFLTAVVRREGRLDVAVSPARAISALSLGAPPDDAVPVLTRVLADRAGAPTDRATVARGWA